ncbi:hypothetical protein [uncultured Gammaproteobacteria bacterium]|nr:hypothetical protein [uncultured Gammaproteobacteria bacterium]
MGILKILILGIVVFFVLNRQNRKTTNFED